MTWKTEPVDLEWLRVIAVVCFDLDDGTALRAWATLQTPGSNRSIYQVVREFGDWRALAGQEQAMAIVRTLFTSRLWSLELPSLARATRPGAGLAEAGADVVAQRSKKCPADLASPFGVQRDKPNTTGAHLRDDHDRLIAGVVEASARLDEARGALERWIAAHDAMASRAGKRSSI